MSSPPSIHQILSLGLDREIMKLRSAVLRSGGYSVLEAFKLEDGLRIFRSVDLDLALLCHSIPELKQSEVALAMKCSRPLTPIIALLRGFAQVKEADLSISNLSGPEELLQCIASLLKQASETGSCEGLSGKFSRLRKRA